MKLADLRKLSIRKNLKIHFPLSNGMECVVTERGIAEVPGLARVPDFNLEQELAAASAFTLEPLGGDKKHPAQPRPVGREELVSLARASLGGAAGQEEED